MNGGAVRHLTPLITRIGPILFRASRKVIQRNTYADRALPNSAAAADLEHGFKHARAHSEVLPMEIDGRVAVSRQDRDLVSDAKPLSLVPQREISMLLIKRIKRGT